MTDRSKYKPLVPAVDQAAKILLCLANSAAGGMTVTQVCEKIGIHKSKGYSILQTLMQFAFIIKNKETKTYSLGPGLLSLTKNIHENLDIKKVSDPILKNLAFETKCTVLLGIVSHDQFFIIETYEIDEIFGVTTHKNRALHITHGAHGKAIAAFMDKKGLDKLLKKKDLEFYGKDNTLNIDKFKKELSVIRGKGFAVDDGSVTPGIKAVSSPVFDSDEKIIAGIVILGTFPKEKYEEYGQKVAEKSREISIKLGAQI